MDKATAIQKVRYGLEMETTERTPFGQLTVVDTEALELALNALVKEAESETVSANVKKQMAIDFFQRHMREDVLRYGERTAIRIALDALTAEDHAAKEKTVCRYCTKDDNGAICWQPDIDVGVTIEFRAGKFRITSEAGDEVYIDVAHCPICGRKI